VSPLGSPSPGRIQGVEDRAIGLSVDNRVSAHALTAEALCQTYGGQVYKFAQLISTDSGKAEDLAQDALERAIRGLKTFNPNKGEVEAWLWRIVVNAARDAGRIAGRRRLVFELLAPRITSCCGDAVWRVFQVDFLDANIGWAIAPPAGWTKASPVGDWLYRTTDGGRTWALLQKDVPLGYPVISLLVIDGNDAFAAQYQNATVGAPIGPGTELLKTTDGGRTWKVVA
jgi:Sigma-70 region 2